MVGVEAECPSLPVGGITTASARTVRIRTTAPGVISRATERGSGAGASEHRLFRVRAIFSPLLVPLLFFFFFPGEDRENADTDGLIGGECALFLFLPRGRDKRSLARRKGLSVVTLRHCLR